MSEDWKPAGRLRYPDYLRLCELLSLQHPVSRPEHHDETLFIVVHQAFELWFKLTLHTLDGLDRAMVAGDAAAALKLARRAATIVRSVTGQIDVLETMSALDFLEFRSGLEGASGFQSAQFRELEAALGLAEPARVPVQLEGFAPGRDSYFGPLLPAERERIERRLAAPSIEERFLEWIAREVPPAEPGRVHPDDLVDLLAGRPEAARAVAGRLGGAARVVDPEMARGLGERLARLPLWQGLGADERAEVAEALLGGEAAARLGKLGRLAREAAEWADVRLLDEEAARRATVAEEAAEQALRSAGLEADELAAIRRGLGRRTALRALYRRPAPAGLSAERGHALWLVAEALVDLSQAVSAYRFRHVQMVERMIGKRRGTGGSPGVAYLEKTLGYRAFPELLRVRTHL